MSRPKNNAKIISTRRLADGRRFVEVVCPRCQHRHWLPDTGTGICPRRTTAAPFAIASEGRK